MAGALAAQIEHRRLARKHPGLGSGDHSRESRRPPGCPSWIAWVRLIGGIAPRRGRGTICGPGWDNLVRTGTAISGRSGRSRGGDANVGESIDQSGINGESLAVYHPGIRGNGEVRSYRGDNPVRHYHRRVLKRRRGHRHNFCATNRKGARLAALSPRGGGCQQSKPSSKKHKCPQAQLNAPPTHVLLLVLLVYLPLRSPRRTCIPRRLLRLVATSADVKCQRKKRDKRNDACLFLMRISARFKASFCRRVRRVG